MLEPIILDWDIPSHLFHAPYLKDAVVVSRTCVCHHKTTTVASTPRPCAHLVPRLVASNVTFVL